MPTLSPHLSPHVNPRTEVVPAAATAPGRSYRLPRRLSLALLAVALVASTAGLTVGGQSDPTPEAPAAVPAERQAAPVGRTLRSSRSGDTRSGGRRAYEEFHHFR